MNRTYFPKPYFVAMATASVRLPAPSFIKMPLTWNLMCAPSPATT